MSDYVFPEDQEALFDFGSYYNSSDNQCIDPALLQLRAPEANQDLRPIVPDLRPFELTNMGLDSCNLPLHENATRHVTTSPRLQCADLICLQSSAHLSEVTGAVNDERRPSVSASRSASYESLLARPERRRTIATVLRCEFDGCSYEGTFSRKYELGRHIRSRHGGGVLAFTCGALGCFKRGNIRWTFARPDKLTDHIRAVHALDTSFSGCPQRGCNLGPQPLGVLGAHIERFHRYQYQDLEARSIVNATTAKQRRCPLLGCKNKIFPLDDFLLHLATHEAEDVHAFKSSSCFEGLKLEFVSIHEASNAPIVSVDIDIACPVCGHLSPSFKAFQFHLGIRHLFLDPSRGAERLSEAKDPFNTHPFSPISTILNDRSTMKPEDEIISELGPFRMQILRLFPNFLGNPVFDDLV